MIQLKFLGSVTCGQGEQSRQRVCSMNNQCHGQPIESSVCYRNGGICPNVLVKNAEVHGNCFNNSIKSRYGFYFDSNFLLYSTKNYLLEHKIKFDINLIC